MRVLEVEGDGLALCADAEGNEQTVETALVGEVTAGERAARARRHGAGEGGGVRFVDEFRDAELGRVLAGEIVSLVEPGAT